MLLHISYAFLGSSSQKEKRKKRKENASILFHYEWQTDFELA
jgi:hypothetical protein